MPSSPAHPLQLGLSALPLTEWLKPEAGDAALLGERARIIAAHEPQVIGFLPEAEAAVRELARLLAVDDRAPPRQILAAIALRKAEDLLVLIEPPRYRLGAGILCFPNRWRLSEKMGQPVTAIHDPVPDYAHDAGAQVDRFLERLRPERVFTRTGWGLASAQTLFLPAPIAPVTPGSGDYILREEVQTFRKLPETGAAVFSIRTRITPWTAVPAVRRAAITETLGELSPAWKAYKSIS
jgi:dimethylamine monooxygenase subunit A